MVKASILLAVLAGVFCPTLTAQAQRLQIKDSVIVLPNGTTWQPGLHRIRYIDTLRVRTTTYYLLIGYPCISDCDVPGGAYLLQPGATIYSDTGAQGIGYPGPKIRVGDQEPSGFMRVFWGNCLSDSSQHFLAFWHPGRPLPKDSVAGGDSAHIIIPFPDSLSTQDIPLTAAINRLVLSQVRKSKCHELT